MSDQERFEKWWAEEVQPLVKELFLKGLFLKDEWPDGKDVAALAFLAGIRAEQRRILDAT